MNTQPAGGDVSENDRDALAVSIAEAWWPNRYVGDLSTDEWRRVYETLAVSGYQADDATLARDVLEAALAEHPRPGDGE